MENRPISEAHGAESLFRYCPSCGRVGIDWNGRAWHCPGCGFDYFHNVAAAAGLILNAQGSCLFLRRAKEPKKGFLALPGGFVDPWEGADEAVLRECREELGWAPQSLKYLASFPNTYRFRDVEYWTCDLFFCSDIAESDLNLLSPHAEESIELLMVRFSEIPWDSIAFNSTKQALTHYLLQ